MDIDLMRAPERVVPGDHHEAHRDDHDERSDNEVEPAIAARAISTRRWSSQVVRVNAGFDRGFHRNLCDNVYLSVLAG
jgi:hypothetical protein